MASYSTGDSAVVISDINDVDMRQNDVLGVGAHNFYSKLSVGPNKTLLIPNSGDVKMSEVQGQIAKLIDNSLLTVNTSAINADDDVVTEVSIS